MAVKKIKTGQEAESPETPVAESQAGQKPSGGQAGDNAENGVSTGQNPETESGEDVSGKPLAKVLVALRPILYLARQYKAGDSLPVNNTEMAEAWIGAGSAEWREEKGGRFFP